MIVITGASGLVGANLVRTLLSENQLLGMGHLRAIVHHDQRALHGLDVELIQADLENTLALQRAFTGAELVFHLAGAISLSMDSWSTVSAVNVTGTRHVLDACRSAGVSRLVYFSSIHSRQQEPLDQPLDEHRALLDDPTAPPYERSKASAELLVQQAATQGLDVVTIIPTAMLGPYDFKPSYIGHAMRLLARGRLPALVSGGYDWVDVRDVVQGTLQAVRSAPAGARYILSGHWVSIPDVARQVNQITGRRVFRPVVPLMLAAFFEPLMVHLARLNSSQPLYTKAMLTALRSNRYVSHARASRDLGYSPRPFQETLKDTLDWLLAQPGQPEA